MESIVSTESLFVMIENIADIEQINLHAEGKSPMMQALESAIRDLCAENERLTKELAQYSGWSPHQFLGLLEEHKALQKKYLEENSERIRLGSELAEVKDELALHKQGVVHIRTPFLR